MRKSLLFSAIILLIIIAGWLFFRNNETEEELFTRAKQYLSEGKNKEAVKVYEKLVKKFPESENRSNAVFMIGFYYANELKEYDKAEKYYKMFLEEYPNDTLAFYAQFELDNLGKDIDSLLFDRIKKEEPKENQEVIKK
ncbi:hypothetical protein AMJ80_09870 [bacterium SM23_31]|nr:MAG: hypothetical protein AMJ80_09870 [bacterium SM23_31]